METLTVESILPNQRAELEAALRPYYAELEPGWAEAPGEVDRKSERLFNDPDRWLWWGVNEAGERVGFVIFRKFRGWPDASEWVGSIAEFTIFPAHRRRGYGIALARQALETLKAAGCVKVEASVLWSRESSFEFWKAVGFKPTFILTEFNF